MVIWMEWSKVVKGNVFDTKMHEKQGKYSILMVAKLESQELI